MNEPNSGDGGGQFRNFGSRAVNGVVVDKDDLVVPAFERVPNSCRDLGNIRNFIECRDYHRNQRDKMRVRILTVCDIDVQSRPLVI